MVVDYARIGCLSITRGRGNTLASARVEINPRPWGKFVHPPVSPAFPGTRGGRGSGAEREREKDLKRIPLARDDQGCAGPAFSDKTARFAETRSRESGTMRGQRTGPD